MRCEFNDKHQCATAPPRGLLNDLSGKSKAVSFHPDSRMLRMLRMAAYGCVCVATDGIRCSFALLCFVLLCFALLNFCALPYAVYQTHVSGEAGTV